MHARIHHPDELDGAVADYELAERIRRGEPFERAFGRRPGGGREGRRGPYGGGGGGGALTLEAQILATAAAAGINITGYLARSSAEMTLGTGDRASVLAHYGAGSDATQGTDAARPTFSATGINGKGGLVFDGGDALVSGSIDTGTATAYALIALFKDTDAVAKFVCSFGDIVSTGIAMKTTGSGIGAQAIASAATSRAESAGTISMATHGVVTATVDTALTGDETEIRHDGTNVTSTRPVNGNPAGSLGAQVITIGAREGPANHFVGTLGAMWLLWHSSAWAGSKLTALAAIEALLAAEWA